MPQPNVIPDGFMQNAQGHMVPIDMVDKLDIERDKMINMVLTDAQKVQGTMTSFRDRSSTRIQKFMEKAFKKYQTKLGGDKGNVSFISYDGNIKLSITIGTQIVFDERIAVAKQLIDECLLDWGKNADPKLMTVIEQAFQTDSEGNAIPSRILGLKSLKIKDTKWNRAMRALNDSQKVGSSKPYFRIYVKDEDGEFKQMPLDMAKLPMMEVPSA